MQARVPDKLLYFNYNHDQFNALLIELVMNSRFVEYGNLDNRQSA